MLGRWVLTKEAAAREAPFLLKVPNRRIVPKSPKIPPQSPGSHTFGTIGNVREPFPDSTRSLRFRHSTVPIRLTLTLSAPGFIGWARN
jgi:hypothetical protein